jgi:hypothetical protein
MRRITNKLYFNDKNHQKSENEKGKVWELENYSFGKHEAKSNQKGNCTLFIIISSIYPAVHTRIKRIEDPICPNEYETTKSPGNLQSAKQLWRT